MSTTPPEGVRRRYEVGVPLGKGGFGSVYAACLVGDGGFKKPVAIKLLRPELADDEHLTVRLRDEARILSMLNHRAVVTVHDLVRLDGRWALVMERVHGVDLGALDGPMPARPALEIVSELASALDLAHNAPGPDGKPLRLLHRDIKPSNVLVTASGAVKVLDFGIARAEFGDREAVTRSVAYGSPEYMAPERLEWENGPEGDLYAVGVLLYEVLSARRFGMSSGHPGKHAGRIAEAQAVLRELDTPPGVVDLVGELLSYEREARPTARALERRCATLIDAAGGQRLRDWAETEIPRLQAARGVPTADALSGSVLGEGDSQERPTRGSMGTLAGRRTQPPPPVLTSAQKKTMVLSFAVTVLFVVGLGGLGLWAYQHDGPPQAVGTGEQPVAPPDPNAPNTTVTPVTPVVTDPVTPPVAAPVVPVVAPQIAEPVKAPPKPTVAPEPTAQPVAPAVPTGKVQISGDAQSVALQTGGRSYTNPSALPPGTYTIQVTFSGHEPMGAGTLEVVENQVVHLVCKAELKRCAVR